MAIKIPNDAVATVPLIIKDLEGHSIAGSMTGITLTLSDSTLASATLSPDGQSVTIVPLQMQGSGTLVYSDTTDHISATLSFSIVEPVPASVTFDEADITLAPNPNPPSAAANPSTSAATGTSPPAAAAAE
jgi:hypothetical protein